MIWETLTNRFAVSMYNLAGRWWGNVSRDEAIELDVVAQSMDGKKLLVGECKWTEGEDAGRLIYELTAKARKLPFLKGQEIVPVLFLKQKPLRESDALVITPQEIIDAIG